MLEAPARAASIALPPMPSFDREVKREESKSHLRASVSPAQPRPRSPPRSETVSTSQARPPPPAYPSYSSALASSNAPIPRESHIRTESKEAPDAPLPSLRSVTGISEALDTSRPSSRFPPQSHITLPPPSQQSYPGYPTPNSPAVPRPSDAAAHFERRESYDRRDSYDRQGTIPHYDVSQQPQQQQQQSTQQPQHHQQHLQQPPQQHHSAPYAHPHADTHHAPPPHHFSSQSVQPPPPPPQRYQDPPAPPQREAQYFQPQQQQSQARTQPERQFAPPAQAYSYGASEPPRLYTQPPPQSAQVSAISPQDNRSYGPARYESAPLQQEASSQPPQQPNGKTYGESVKRHLDSFDLETSLNDISDSARLLHDFSQHYRNKAHHTQRTGHLPGSTPNLNELEDMAKQSARIHEALSRLHDVVLSQQVALAERSKDIIHKPARTLDGEENSLSANSSKDGFAGSEAKKRRGRAAPPGRCHSCNRAETPEWRRGPDGARTLCNACGLHYAKLTRKMGGNKQQQQQLGGSNLKTKSTDESST